MLVGCLIFETKEGNKLSVSMCDDTFEFTVIPNPINRSNFVKQASYRIGMEACDVECFHTEKNRGKI